MRARALLVVGVLAVGLQGCGAIELAAVGTAVVGAGAGSLVKAGTEYTVMGAAYRTYTLPLHDMRDLVDQTLARMSMQIERDEATETGRRVLARAGGREVSIHLERLTPTTTSMKLVVKRGIIRRDRATASEIIAQTDRILLDATASVSPEAGRVPSATRWPSPPAE